MATRSGSATYTSTTRPTAMGGWQGSTSTPSAVGDSGAAGYSENAIARPDFVPYQTLITTFQIGICAFHIESIDYVSLSIDSGPFVRAATRTTNSDTGTVCHNFSIDPSLMPDGLHEARAIAYPVSGVPRVISEIFFNTNYNGTLTSTEKYVATNGNDTTGDGSIATPYATILRAAKAIQTAQGSNADGGIIYLKAGSHVLGAYSFGLLTTTTNRWLTIMPAPGLTKANVTISGSTDSDGIRTKLVRLYDVKVTGTLNTTSGQSHRLWVENCLIDTGDRTVRLSWNSGFGYLYGTDSTAQNTQGGFTGELIRGCTVDTIGELAFQQCGLTVNCTVANIDATGSDEGNPFHPDVYQNYPGSDNVILYGLTATTGINAQGIFAGDNIPVRDMAIVNVSIDNHAYAGGIWRCFSFAGACRHLLVKNSTFVGGQILFDNTQGNMTCSNVVLENTSFTPSLSPVDGVTVR